MVEGGVDQVSEVKFFPLVYKVGPMVAFIEIKDQQGNVFYVRGSPRSTVNVFARGE
jgi:hypothetical protein